ncbi:metallophosphoesterase family protein [Cellvibrio polysaccharolyticus]|nr:metallophosphoesterase [Cellvibrio polysaccharolyticus]
MPDIHFHDIYAEFEDNSFQGLENTISGQRATIRTMQAQLQSTRLFNENYFALIAALDDVVRRGITLVALPGDFSDDGQPIHLRGLQKILAHYQSAHGLQFFAAPGNHDPVKPFDSAAGKADFAGEGGFDQRIFSRGAAECADYDGEWASIDAGYALNTICTEEIRQLGYQGVMDLLSDFGFYPKAEYLYWETPYSSYLNQPSSAYHLSIAEAEADYSKRLYEICLEGTGGKYKKENYTHCSLVADASYLVEPVAGVWLLAIDANVYVPDAQQPDGGYHGSSSAGYNRMVTHKAHVIEWIADVVARASQHNKQLIAFSHFPMTDFYDGQSEAIAEAFGETAFQLQRKPEKHVSQVLADTGLKLHIGGHMHFNDTGMIKGTRGNILFNIQAPSLAAYLPAYKIVTLSDSKKLTVETVVLDDVPRFSELFEHYRVEHQRLHQQQATTLWDRNVLAAKSYREFTQWHIRELVRHRFLPGEWTDEMQTLLFNLKGDELLQLSQLSPAPDWSAFDNQQWTDLKAGASWQAAAEKAARLLSQNPWSMDDFSQWSAFDLAVDFYKIRNAGDLALADIGKARMAQYKLLGGAMQQQAVQQPDAGPIVQISRVLSVLQGLSEGLPNDRFVIDLEKGTLAVH